MLFCCLVHSQPDLVYHRIDLLPTENMCLHLKQLATVGQYHSHPLHQQETQIGAQSHKLVSHMEDMWGLFVNHNNH